MRTRSRIVHALCWFLFSLVAVLPGYPLRAQKGTAQNDTAHYLADDVGTYQNRPGHTIYIAPRYSLVAVFTGGGYNAGSTPPNTIMETIILPRMMNIAAQAKHAMH